MIQKNVDIHFKVFNAKYCIWNSTQRKTANRQKIFLDTAVNWVQHQSKKGTHFSVKQSLQFTHILIVDYSFYSTTANRGYQLFLGQPWIQASNQWLHSLYSTSNYPKFFFSISMWSPGRRTSITAAFFCGNCCRHSGEGTDSRESPTPEPASIFSSRSLKKLSSSKMMSHRFSVDLTWWRWRRGLIRYFTRCKQVIRISAWTVS